MTSEQPSKPPVFYIEGGNFASNTASIISSAFSSPTQVLVLHTEGDGNSATTGGEPPDGNIVVSPHFKMIFVVVVVFTGLFVAADFLLALFGRDPLTATQQTMFDAFDFAWKAGFGAIVGLLTGKQVK